MDNEIQVVETANEAVVRSGLSRNQKLAIIAGATVVTAGIAYGTYRLIKFLRAKRAAKKAEQAEEVHA